MSKNIPQSSIKNLTLNAEKKTKEKYENKTPQRLIKFKSNDQKSLHDILHWFHGCTGYILKCCRCYGVSKN